MNKEKARTWAELTDYPKVYGPSYWGHMPVRYDGKPHLPGNAAAGVRNELARAFKLVKGEYRRGSITCRPADHFEVYLAEDGLVLFLCSPGSAGEAATLAASGWTRIRSAYADWTTSWIRHFPDARAAVAWSRRCKKGEALLVPLSLVLYDEGCMRVTYEQKAGREMSVFSPTCKCLGPAVEAFEDAKV